MAYLDYNGNSMSLDRTILAYIHAVATTKFQEGTGFWVALSGTSNSGAKVYREFWLSPTSSVGFHFETDDAPIELDPAHLQTLFDSVKEIGRMSITDAEFNGVYTIAEA